MLPLGFAGGLALWALAVGVFLCLSTIIVV